MHPFSINGFAASVLAEDAGFEAFDSVAGGETAGIPFAAFLAERLALPMQYVRKTVWFGAMRKLRDTCQRVLMHCWWRIWQQMAVASCCSLMPCVRRGRYVIARLVFYYDIFDHARDQLKTLASPYTICQHGGMFWMKLNRVIGLTVSPRDS